MLCPDLKQLSHPVRQSEPARMASVDSGLDGVLSLFPKAQCLTEHWLDRLFLDPVDGVVADSMFLNVLTID